MMLVLGGLLLTGCMKEELPVPAAPRGDAVEVRLCMGQGYQQQYWFDLGSASVVRENNFMAWDLAFESGAEGWRIMLNGGRLMLAWNTGATAIDAAVDVNAVAFSGVIDAPSGHPDSTAIGDWRNAQPLIVLDMGYDAAGNILGVRRIRPLSVTSSAYTLEVAAADGSNATVLTVPKDAQRSWVHFNLDQGMVQVAPPNGQWDIVLTRYSHIFRDINLPYLVVGALIDGNTTRVSRITNADFEAVVLADTLLHPFARQRDIIGYDWKEFSFDTNAYTVDTGIVYIVQVADGSYYKLHFRDFYGTSGQAGCPLFAVKAL